MGTSGQQKEHSPSEEDKPLLAGLAVAGTPEKTTQDWTTKVFETELSHLDAHGCLDDRNALNGIALSGGGVRSAVVCLGVLGALAKEGLLHKFHYLSSVSGGGYAGAAYSHWMALRQKELEESKSATGAELPKEAIRDMSCPFNTEPVTNPNWGDQSRIEAERLSAQNNAYVRHLRANISYLMPGGFRSMVSGAYVVLRCILLNVLIWTLLTAGVFQIALYLDDLVDGPIIGAVEHLTSLEFTESDVDLSPKEEVADTEEILADALQTTFKDTPLFLVLSALGTLALVACFVLMPVFSLLTVFNDIPGESKAKRQYRFIPQFLVTFLKRLGTFLPSLVRLFERVAQFLQRAALYLGYEWRAINERLAQVLFTAALAFCTVGLLPFAAEYLEQMATPSDPGPPAGYALVQSDDGSWQITEQDDGSEADQDPASADAATLGTIGALLGVAASLFGFIRTRIGGVFGVFSTTVVLLGSTLLLYSVGLLAFVLAHDLPVWDLLPWVLCALALALFCHANDVSLGRFYRDRLMETFLPDGDKIKAVEPGSNSRLARKAPLALEADQMPLSHLKDSGAPIHLVNTNVMAWWSDDSRAQRRRGDNFILSALTCGSDVTGWRDTQDVSGGKLTLATAMATSGAAVSPGGGFAGQGPTTNVIVSLAMAFLSLRLGYWLQWNHKFWSPSSRYGNHIQPAAALTFGQIRRQVWPKRPTGVANDSSNHEFLELTDGGHFENLGLYELVRRRCAVIVVVDGGEDREASYESFSAALRRVREDFNAKIKFDLDVKRSPKSGAATYESSGPQDLVPRKADDEFPSGVDYASKGYFVASVTYADPEPGMETEDGFRAHRTGGPQTGLLIYLKSAMVRELSLPTKGYSGVNSKFPYDPTTNQFFSPEQFEAYRDLGTVIANQMMKEVDLKRVLAQPAPFENPATTTTGQTLQIVSPSIDALRRRV